MRAHHIRFHLGVEADQVGIAGRRPRREQARSGMGERHTPTPDRPDAGRYEIRLTWHLDARWAAWFDRLTVGHERDGTTVLSGPIADQAALHGVIQRVRDLGLPLVSVTRIETNQPDPPTTDPR
jgi:hypothetical protein